MQRERLWCTFFGLVVWGRHSRNQAAIRAASILCDVGGLLVKQYSVDGSNTNCTHIQLNDHLVSGVPFEDLVVVLR